VWMADSGTTPDYERMNITRVEDLIEAVSAFKKLAPRAHHGLITALEEEALLREVIVYHHRALASYLPRRTFADLVYIRARERDSLLDNHSETWWMGFADGLFTMHNAPGNHFTMMEAPHVATLARLVRLHVGGVAAGERSAGHP
jgi:thioesterase domain-containing protein